MKVTRSNGNCFRRCISAKLSSIDTKLGTLHRHHEIRIYAKVGNSATYGCWDNKKCTILLITFESIVQIVLFLYHLIPWDMLILTDVSFVNFHECACQPYWSKWKTVFFATPHSILSNFVQNLIIWSLDRPAQNDWTDFLYSLPFPRNTSRKLT